MIIYEDDELVIPSGIGPTVNTESGEVILDRKTVSITKNGTVKVVPGSGYNGISECNIITNVPTQINNQEKSVTYTENGEYAVTPDLAYTGMDRVNITVNLPEPPLQEKTVDSSNNSQEVVADSSYYGLSKVNVNPYVLDSKTVDSSTVMQEVYSDVDGLSKVTVEPYELDEKTVDSSTNEQVVTSDVDGLSKVIVTPYILDEKIVDSSTKSQVVTSDVDGLSKVTINPYILNSLEVDSSTANQEFTGQYGTVTVNKYVLDSKTVDSSTMSQIVTSDVDGLKQVTVNPYVLDSKTVDSSTVAQVITSDEDGLSKVTINPYVLDSKTVDPSTNQQIVTSDKDGLSSVTVNPISLTQSTLSTKYVFSPSKAGEIVYTDPSSGYIGFSRVGQYSCYRGSMTLDPSTNDVTYKKSDYFQAPPYNLSPTNATYNTDVSSVKVNKVTSAIDSNIQPQNIVKGVSILGVQGTFALQEKTVDSSTELQVLYPESGYNGFSSVTVNPYYTKLQDKTIDSSTSVQTISYDSGYGGLNSVTINPLPLQKLYLSGPWPSALSPSGPVTDIVDYTYETIKAPFTPEYYYPADGYHGFSQVGVSKAMINIGYEFKPRTEDVVYDVRKWPWSTPAGVIGGVEWDESAERADTNLVGVNKFTIKAVDATIDANIQPENIKPGVTMLGVQCTYVPDLEDKIIYWYPTYYTDTDTDSSIKFTPDEPYIGMSSLLIYKVPIKNSLEITPSTQQQEFDASVMYTSIQGFRNVTVKAVEASIDTNIQPGNIKSGVSILGVEGTFEGGTLQTMTVDSSTSSQLFTPTQGNYGIGSITVNPYVLDSKTVDPSTNSQTITSDVDGLSSVTINPYVLDSKTVDSSTVAQVITSDEDGLASVTINPYVLSPLAVNSSTAVQEFTGQYGTVTVSPYVLDSKTVDSSTVAQTIVSSEDGLASVTINPYVLDSKTVNPSTSVQTVTSSEDGLSQVTVNAVTSSIDTNIAAGNIKDGVTILGVTGNYTGAIINNQNKTVDASTNQQSVTYDSEYTGLGTVTINPYTLTTSTIDSSTAAQTVSVPTGYNGLSSVTISGLNLDNIYNTLAAY